MKKHYLSADFIDDFLHSVLMESFNYSSPADKYARQCVAYALEWYIRTGRAYPAFMKACSAVSAADIMQAGCSADELTESAIIARLKSVLHV